MDSLHIWATYVLIVLSVAGYAMERWPIEAVAAASLSAFLLLFSVLPFADASGQLVTSADLLSGFANPALITVLSLLIVGQGLFATDAMARPTQWVTRFSGSAGPGAIAVVLLCAAALSAFLNNTPVVVIFIPILTMLATQRGVSPAHVFMPLSFLSILGGVTTLIGSSTNLLVAGVALRSGIHLGFFDFTVPGLAIAVVGGFYVVKIMPRILSPREASGGRVVDVGGKQFLGEIDIVEGHAFQGITARAGLFPGLSDLTPRMILRGETTILPPFDDVTLSPGDRLIVTATRRAFSKALSAGNLSIKTLDPSGGTRHGAAQQDRPGHGDGRGGRRTRFALCRADDAVFGPEDPVRDHPLRPQRKSRMARSALVGDPPRAGRHAAPVRPRIGHRGPCRGNHDLLLLEYSRAADPAECQGRNGGRDLLRHRRRCSAAGVLPIEVLAVTGAVLMVASAMPDRSARRSGPLDHSILLLIGASLAAAAALEPTGGAVLIAARRDRLSRAGFVPLRFTLSGLFLIVAIMTNFLSNNATAVLFTPIALEVARQARRAAARPSSPASSSRRAPPSRRRSATRPISLVMGPGRYRFGDFSKAGVPLVILVWLTFSIVGPWYYGLWYRRGPGIDSPPSANAAIPPDLARRPARICPIGPSGRCSRTLSGAGGGAERSPEPRGFSALARTLPTGRPANVAVPACPCASWSTPSSRPGPCGAIMPAQPRSRSADGRRRSPRATSIRCSASHLYYRDTRRAAWPTCRPRLRHDGR